MEWPSHSYSTVEEKDQKTRAMSNFCGHKSFLRVCEGHKALKPLKLCGSTLRYQPLPAISSQIQLQRASCCANFANISKTRRVYPRPLFLQCALKLRHGMMFAFNLTNSYGKMEFSQKLEVASFYFLPQFACRNLFTRSC